MTSLETQSYSEYHLEPTRDRHDLPSLGVKRDRELSSDPGAGALPAPDLKRVATQPDKPATATLSALVAYQDEEEEEEATATNEQAQHSPDAATHATAECKHAPLSELVDSSEIVEIKHTPRKPPSQPTNSILIQAPESAFDPDDDSLSELVTDTESGYSSDSDTDSDEGSDSSDTDSNSSASSDVDSDDSDEEDLAGVSKTPRTKRPSPPPAERGVFAARPWTYESRPRICQSCETRKAKYTCPGCYRRTCSVSCYVKHKSDHGCTGKRDRTKFAKLSEMNDATLHSDIGLLHEISQLCGSAARQLKEDPTLQAAGEQPLRPKQRSSVEGPIAEALSLRGVSSRLRHLMAQALIRGIKFRLSPTGLTRNKINSSYYASREKQIYWFMQFIFPSAKPPGEVASLDTGTTQDQSLPVRQPAYTIFSTPVPIPELATWRDCLGVFLGFKVPTFEQALIRTPKPSPAPVSQDAVVAPATTGAEEPSSKEVNQEQSEAVEASQGTAPSSNTKQERRKKPHDNYFNLAQHPITQFASSWNNLPSRQVLHLYHKAFVQSQPTSHNGLTTPPERPGLRIFLRMISPANQPVFVEFSLDAKIRDSLKGVDVQDFPTVYVLHPEERSLSIFTRRLERANDLAINWNRRAGIEIVEG